jgi:ABC-2 type transport system permease protein
MKRVSTLLLRELSSFFYSPIAYLLLFFFLILNGLSFFFAVISLSRGPSELTVVQVFFNSLFFWLTYLLVFPVITMRLFAEEFKLGTIETLMTAPIQDWQVVCAKYLSAFFLYLFLWLPSLAYFLVFGWFGGRTAVGSGAQLWAPYLLLCVMGLFNIALGCLASALTSNQLVAAMLTLLLTVGFYFLAFGNYVISGGFALEIPTAFGGQLSSMESFSRGVVDSRPLVLYLSLSFLVLVITYHIFQYRRWKV